MLYHKELNWIEDYITLKQITVGAIYILFLMLFLTLRTKFLEKVQRINKISQIFVSWGEFSNFITRKDTFNWKVQPKLRSLSKINMYQVVLGQWVSFVEIKNYTYCKIIDDTFSVICSFVLCIFWWLLPCFYLK